MLSSIYNGNYRNKTMGNIINDIVEDINIKPNKTKIVLKWLITIAVGLIGLAFIFGQFKSSFFNRMDDFEKSINKNTTTLIDMKADLTGGIKAVDTRIDDLYTDGFEAFDDYQQFNKKQLLFVLDYGQTNKKLLKEMLELNMEEKTRSVESKLEQAKNESTQSSIGVRKVEKKK